MLTYWKSLCAGFSSEHPLSRRLWWYTLFCCIALALLLTLSQLGLSYRQGVDDARNRLNEVVGTHLSAIAASIWNMDNEQLHQQIAGLQKLPDIQAITVYERVDEHLLQRQQTGKKHGMQTLTQRYPLFHAGHTVGELEVVLTLVPIYQSLLHKSWYILFTQLLQTILAGLSVFLLFQMYLLRHLQHMHDFLQHDIRQPATPLILSRQSSDNEQDELALIVSSLNEIRNTDHQAWQTQKAQPQSEPENSLSDQQLKQLVAERTQHLEEKLRKLQTAYDAMQNARESQSELQKILSLSALVSGMTHALNTPLGLNTTALRFLSTRLKELDAIELPESQENAHWHQQLTEIHESFELLQQQTRKATDLVNNFQQIAITPNPQQTCRFNLAEALHQLVVSFGIRLNQQQCHVTVQCDPTLEMNSYPSAFSRICHHLLQNSLDHGFRHCNRPRSINIQLTAAQGYILLDYYDNGQGIEPELQPHIFEPFVSGHHEQGFVGLGCYIIYNQVVQLLKGEIKCHSNFGNGVHFHIEIPKQA